MDSARPSSRRLAIGDLVRWGATLGGGALLLYGLAKRSPGGAALALLGGDLVYHGLTRGDGHLRAIFGSESPPDQVSLMTTHHDQDSHLTAPRTRRPGKPIEEQSMSRKKKQKHDTLTEESLENSDAVQDEDSMRAELDHIDAVENIDEDVKDMFQEAQALDYGREELARKLVSYTDKTPELTGGDVDASWEYADVGEETVGGQNPTPDQSVVEEAGQAIGLTYQDNEPLGVDDKVGERDRRPWELDPASSPDFSERVAAEFHAPLETLGIQPAVAPQPQTKKTATRRSTQGRATPARRAASARTAGAGRGTPARKAKARSTTVHRRAKVRTTAKPRSAGGDSRSKGSRATPNRNRGSGR